MSGPKYTIFIDYSTGDSFNTREILGQEVGFVWRDYDQAVKAAKLIKNHNELMIEAEKPFHWEAKAREKAWNNAMQSEWRKNYKKLYPKHKPRDSIELYSCFAVEDDNGDPVVINPFWYGHFETLKGIRVGIVEENIL